ncbi:MAG: hypothetical protein IJV00_04240 [Clostridia bacterium]|nr:hypothetical protein [Clostridia bacterium]
MKKIFLFIFCFLLILPHTGCSRPDRPSAETPASSAEAAPEPGYDGRHTLRYGALDPDFLELLISREQTDEYINVFWYSEDRNYGALCDYFGISSESFGRAVRLWKEREQKLGLTEEVFENEYPELFFWEKWFGDFKNDPAFLSGAEPDTVSVTLRCESDALHTDRYYTIDRRLIEYVGTRSFGQFKDKYAGTEQFNILNFIDTFEITKEEYVSLFERTSRFREEWVSYPYSPEYLFGDAEKQALYFCRGRIADPGAAKKTQGSCRTHVEGFHEISYYPFLEGLITSEQYYNYMKMFTGTEDANYGAVFDYYGVTEEQYRAKVESVKNRLGLSDREFKTLYPLAECYEAWFAPDRCSREEFVFTGTKTPSVTARDPEDEIHTDRYFTIDSVLIEYVGESEFEKFRSRYAGSASFNILSFLDEFDVSASEILRIYEEAKLTFVPYRPAHLFTQKIDGNPYVDPPPENQRDFYYLRGGPYREIGGENKETDLYSKIYAVDRTADATHVRGYTKICYYPILSDLISREDFDRYCTRFTGTADFNYGALIRYFSISRADYESAVEKVKASREYPEERFVELFGYADSCDEWYSDDYESFFRTDLYVEPEKESITIRPEDDEVHTDRYFTIDSELLRFAGNYGVGVFTEKYAGTEYFNIKSFLRYFEITRDVYEWIYRNKNYPLPYKTEYLFPSSDADPDETAAYFLKQTPTPGAAN